MSWLVDSAHGNLAIVVMRTFEPGAPFSLKAIGVAGSGAWLVHPGSTSL